MKAYISLILAVLLCLSLLGCSEKRPVYTMNDYSDSNEPTEITITSPPFYNNPLHLVDKIQMTTDKGSIVYSGVEYANKTLTDSESAAVFCFSFTNRQDQPAAAYSAFLINYYQNGVQVNESLRYSGLVGDHQLQLCSSYRQEIEKETGILFGCPVLLNDNSPVTVIIYELGNHENYQTMIIDLSEVPIVPVDTSLPAPTHIPNAPVSMESKKGNLRYLGFENAHNGLLEDDRAIVFQFEYTNYQDLPTHSHNSFNIGFYQNNEEIKASEQINHTGDEQYTLCSNRYRGAMKDGTITFGLPVVLKDSSPVTITIEAVGYWDTKLSIEVTPVF